MAIPDSLHRQFAMAYSDALHVGDSPLRADRLADQLPGLARAIELTDLHEDSRKRIAAALAVAERVLRRDDDGREAARHLNVAIGLLGPAPRKPSPFLDE